MLPMRVKSPWLLVFAVITVFGATWQLPASDKPLEKGGYTLLQTPLLSLPTWNPRPFIKVTVNESKPLLLVVDTGSDVDLFLGKEVAKRIFSIRQARRRVDTLTGNASAKVEVAEVDLKISKLSAPNATVGIADFPVPVPFDGVIGFQFLKRFVTTIDWKARQFTISQSCPQPKQMKSVALMQEYLDQHKPVVQGQVNGDNLNFLLDTGASVTLIPEHLAKQLTFKHLVKSIWGIGIGSNLTECLCGRVQSICIGAEQVVTDPVVAFPVGQQANNAQVHLSQGLGILGADVLQKFRLTIDGPGGQVYFERVNPEPKGEFDEPGVGIALALWRKTVNIAQVYEPSPASRAGVRVSDKVLEINGQSVKDNLEQALQQLRGKEGEKVNLTVLRNRRRIRFEMTREKIL